MKIAPIYERMLAETRFDPYLIHTGQHYDHAMSDLFFKHLGLPEPHRYLGVGSAGHGEQTGKIMVDFERAMLDIKPQLVVVVGDVNSTIACGLVAVKLGIKLAHVEAGLRSFDRTMPEEINRVLTDQISDYLFTTERSALENLRAEGIDVEKVFFVGNVMIDSLRQHQDKAADRDVLQRLGIAPKEFALVTLHRPSNVDDSGMLQALLTALAELSCRVPVVFPVHPRSRNMIERFALNAIVEENPGMRLVDPLGYLDFLHCMSNAKVVITDSGGIQEETTALGVPCITVRDNTERPVTVTEGTNVVVGRDPDAMLQEALAALEGRSKAGGLPALWDGKASRRIVEILAEKLLGVGSGAGAEAD
jgi:UDP-N-acetylglucosamine 2-epimerase (non-hydrolysing)